MRLLLKLSVILAASSCLAGCFLPTYHVKHENRTTVVDLPTEKLAFTYICQNGKYKMVRGFSEPTKVNLPYGKRVSVKVDYEHILLGYGYDKCSPKISFIPKKNRRYKLHLALHDNKCQIVVFYYDAKSKIGLSQDRTMGPGDCF